MKTTLQILSIQAGVALALAPLAPAAQPTGSGVSGNLSQAHGTLFEAVSDVEKSHGPAIAARYDMKDGKLVVRVESAVEGIHRNAEENSFTELTADATQPGSPAVAESIGGDTHHTARSAMQLTVLQTSKLSLPEVISLAECIQPGRVYSVAPTVKDGKPRFAVKMQTDDGREAHLLFDPETCDIAK